MNLRCHDPWNHTGDNITIWYAKNSAKKKKEFLKYYGLTSSDLAMNSLSFSSEKCNTMHSSVVLVTLLPGWYSSGSNSAESPETSGVHCKYSLWRHNSNLDTGPLTDRYWFDGLALIWSDKYPELQITPEDKYISVTHSGISTHWFRPSGRAAGFTLQGKGAHHPSIGVKTL